ncbi:MAG: helix-turn-helix domain-containing protein [Peptococcaceae bacterium]|nr:helix-turn-helix domain-containing protein [Peptococcaceae bacterium]
MGFSDNLKNIRRERNLSQEQLAELLNVSRQAVSKWEQDGGYPETEKLLQLSQKLDISLDALLLDSDPKKGVETLAPQTNTTFSGERRISIHSLDGASLSSFIKFAIVPRLGTKGQGYSLCGIDRQGDGFWSVDSFVVLGYYTTKASAQKELSEIHQAIQNGEAAYQLKHHMSLIAVQSHKGKTYSACCQFSIEPFSSKKNLLRFRVKGVRIRLADKTDIRYSAGDDPVTLGWYATEEDAQKELNEIHQAVQNGEPVYEIKYHVKAKGILNPKIID